MYQSLNLSTGPYHSKPPIFIHVASYGLMKLTSKLEIWARKTKKMRQLSNVVQRKINFSNLKSFNSLYACRVNGSIKFQGLGSCFHTGSVLSWWPHRILAVPVLWLTWTLYSHYVYGRLCNSPVNKEMEGILFRNAELSANSLTDSSDQHAQIAFTQSLQTAC